MGKKNKSSDDGAAAGFVILLLLWLVVKFIWWIVAALVLVGLFYLARAVVRQGRRRRELYAQWCAAICSRAEQQHNWALSGDDRGIYGVEGAQLMREIRSVDGQRRNVSG